MLRSSLAAPRAAAPVLGSGVCGLPRLLRARAHWAHIERCIAVFPAVQALRAPVALPLSGNVVRARPIACARLHRLTCTAGAVQGQVRSKHYKLKTRKAAAKRLTVLGSGKIKFYTAGLRHNAQPKNAARRRRLRTHQYVPSTLMQHARRMLCI